MTHPWLHAARDPQRLAIVMADTGEQRTYGELVEQSNRYTRLFQRLGMQRGDTLSILMENRPDYLVLAWAAKNAGLYYVGVSTHLTADEAAYIVENSESKVLIGSAQTLELLLGIRARIGDACLYKLIDAAANEIPCITDELDASSAKPQGTVRGASMLYSSGTTGRPKGVRVPLTGDPPEVPPVRHGMLCRAFGYDRETVFIDPGPLYHAGPLRFAMAVQREGGTVVSSRKFDSLQTLRAMQRYAVTHGLFVPTMFIRMLRLDAALRESFNPSHLKAVVHAAAPCPIAIKEQMLEWWGPVIHELYGGTEGSGITIIGAHEWLERKGSVGRPVPGCEVHILDDAGEEVPANVQGRVYLHSPRRFEYYKDPQKTRAAHHPKGWSTMGDVGYVDAQGYLYLTDRQSETIISGGVNIYPQEAESILQGHPHVADVAVFGVPDAEFGEAVKAVVQLEPGVHAGAQTARELMDFCRARLSAIKCPRSIDFIERLPRQENGKLYKRLLKDRYWAGHRTRII